MNRSFAYKFFIPFGIILIMVDPSYALTHNKEDDTRMSNLKRIIGVLAHDSLGGRATASIYESKAADFISDEISKHSSLHPEIHYFNFMLNGSETAMNSKSVYCFINNNSQKTILLGAHYDHLGLGEYHSLSYGSKGQVHNGADDNASGVALQLEILRNLKVWNNLEYNYVFVWYSAHEIGLYGSQAFNEFARKKFPKIELVVNFDMVGRLDTKERILSVYGYNSIKQMDTYFVSTSNPFKVYLNEDKMIALTDAGTFNQSGIKAISFTTGMHDDYHKVSDDADTINYEGLVEITNYVEAFLKQINYN